ncbi:MAG: hypothetical protein ABIK44_01970 [candidate division WOR-3 bacterium]
MERFIHFCVVWFLLSAPVAAQVLDTLYLPDSLGGSSELEGDVPTGLTPYTFNSVMNRLYLYSSPSDNIVVLDCQNDERTTAIHDVIPRSPWLTWAILAYNPNNNCLYRGMRGNSYSNIDSLLFVTNCSTQAIVDTITIHPEGRRILYSRYLGVNIPANKLFWSVSLDSEGPVTYIIDAQTNEIRTRIQVPPIMVHHQQRPVAYSYPTDYGDYNIPISVIDAANDTVIDTIQPPDGVSYHKVLLVSDIERMFVGAHYYYDPGRIRIVDCLTNEVIGDVPLPIRGREIAQLAYNSCNNRLYVRTSSSKVYVIDLDSNQVTDSILLQREIWSMVYNPNANHLYIAASHEVMVYDGATNGLIDEIAVPHRAMYTFLHPDANKLYVANSECISVIDCAQRQLMRCFKVAYLNRDMMWQPVTNRLYFNDIFRDDSSAILVVYDANTNLPLKVVNLAPHCPPEEWFYHMTTATRPNKIYLASGGYTGLYVLDGNTDSLKNFISCEVGGHHLLYSPRQNKLYAVPYSSINARYLYIFDCANDSIRNVIDFGECSLSSINPYTDNVYVLWGRKTFVIDGAGDTVLRVLDSTGWPIAFRNKGAIHQVYIGCPYRNRLNVLDAIADTVIDSVIDVSLGHEHFCYYDSIDDRIYYPHSNTVLVIDCPTNRITETIPFWGRSLGLRLEEHIGNPVSNRLYLTTIDSISTIGNPMVTVIDCATNTKIDSFCYFQAPTIMQWNYINNVVYVNEHVRARAIAIRDDLIGIREERAESQNRHGTALLSPSVGSRFVLRQRPKGELRLIDITGRVVGKVGRNEEVLDARCLAPGVYFATVQTQGRVELVQKLTVVR